MAAKIRVKRKACKDCKSPTRKADYVGPRCYTCHRAVVRTRQDRAFDQRLRATYGITAEQYWQQYERQGRRCAICQRATGASKKLAVDHNHSCCSTTPTCGTCNRGLLCATCNKTLGHYRDDPAAFARAAEYLRNPPFRLTGNSTVVRGND